MLAARAVSVRPTAVNAKLAPVEQTPLEAGRSFYGKAARVRAVGPFAVATFASILGTCPDSCPFKSVEEDGLVVETNGCFVETGLTGILMRRLNANAREYRLTADEIAEAEAEMIDRLWGGGAIPQDGARGGRDMRVHVGGDVATERGARLIGAAAQRFTHARGGGTVWTYTHWWREIPREAFGTISVLASIERAEDAPRALARGYAPAITVEAFPEGGRAFSLPEAPGVRFVPCPQETRGTTCVECRLCLDVDLANLKTPTGIAFAAHGGSTERVKRKLRVLNPSMTALLETVPQRVPNGDEARAEVDREEPELGASLAAGDVAGEPAAEPVPSPGGQAGVQHREWDPRRETAKIGGGKIGRPAKGWNPWDDLTWEEHDEARRLVRENPDGMTLEEIGSVMGITRERVRQIEHAAIEKLKEAKAGAALEGERPVPDPLPRCEECAKRFVREFGRQTCCSSCIVDHPNRSRSQQRYLLIESRRRRRFRNARAAKR